MKVLQLIFLFALWMKSDALLGFENFKQKIKPLCYLTKEELRNAGREQVVLPHSIEAFIGLVEKLERFPDEQSPRFNSAKSVIGELLTNFRYDDLEYDRTALSFSTRSTPGKTGVTNSHVITQLIFEGLHSSINIQEVYTIDEICSLFFMLSHTVNATYNPDEESETLVNNKKEAKYPKEQGVLSIASDLHQAFSIGKVLLGMLAGLQDREDGIDSFYFLEKMKQGVRIPENLREDKIDPVYAVTFGDIISVPYFEGQKNGDMLIQNIGYWRDISCPTDYVLDGKNKQYHVTASLIRGAIDGYALGKQVKKLFPSGVSPKLSQILRIFYSGESFPDMSGELSVCSRRQLWNTAKINLLTEAQMYQELHMALDDTSVDNKDIVRNYCNTAANSIERNKNLFDDNVEATCGTSPDGGDIRDETPRNIMAIFDNQADYLKKEAQRQIIGNMSSGFIMREDGSVANVFTNMKRTDSDLLNTIVNASHISGCGSCAIKYFDPIELTSENPTDVIRRLNRTLYYMNEKYKEENGVPGKVLLYFNYQSQKQDHQLREAINVLQYFNRDTTLLAIGSDKLSLRQYVRDELKDVFTYAEGNTPALIVDLAKRTQRVPAEFQYDSCYHQNGQQEDKYEGYITPHRSQYWAMYPKYFLKSYYITLTFTVDAGTYKACFSRRYDDILGQAKPREEFCSEVTSAKPFVREVRNPCYKYNEGNCDPFYFYLEGKTAPENVCTSTRCSNTRQIQFTFTHKGVSCNGAASLSTAFVLSIFLCIAVMFHQRKM